MPINALTTYCAELLVEGHQQAIREMVAMLQTAYERIERSDLQKDRDHARELGIVCDLMEKFDAALSDRKQKDDIRALARDPFNAKILQILRESPVPLTLGKLIEAVHDRRDETIGALIILQHAELVECVSTEGSTSSDETFISLGANDFVIKEK